MTERNHTNNRSKICLMCLCYLPHYNHGTKAKKFHVIKAEYEVDIKKHFVPLYSFSDECWPSSLCGSCLSAIYESRKGIFKRIVKPYDYAQVIKNKMVTRRAARIGIHCKCLFCAKVESFSFSDKKLQTPKLRKKIPQKKVLCSECLSPLSRGLAHKCNKETLIKNAQRLVADKKVDEALASNILKRKSQDKGKGINLKRFKGKCAKVLLGNPKHIEEITKEDVQEIQKSITGSQRKSQRLLTKLRKKGIPIAKGIPKQIINKEDSLHAYFDVEQKYLEVETGIIRKKELRTIVFCSNLQGFIDFVIEERKLGAKEDLMLKFGCDSGGGSLKLNITIAPKYERYDNQQNALTSAKRLFIIGITNNTVESRFNLLEIFSLIGFTDIFVYGMETWFTADLKIHNLSIGIQGHSSSHPCEYCDAEKTDLENGNYTLRDFGSIRRQNQLWLEKSGKKGDLAKYLNCEATPVFVDTPDEARVLEIIPPPELHLFTGTFNYLINKAENVDKDAIEAWINACHVIKNGQGSDFNGNACKKLLNNYEMLRKLIIPDAAFFVSIFGALKLVVEACFGQELKPDYTDRIEHFIWLLREHKISFTPKIHIIAFHVVEFLEVNQRGLGVYSEQPFETVHHEWTNFFNTYGSSSAKENFSTTLLRGVIKFKCRNL